MLLRGLMMLLRGLMLLRRARCDRANPARAFGPRRRGMSGVLPGGAGAPAGAGSSRAMTSAAGRHVPAGLAKSGGSEPNASESSPANSVRLLLG